MERKEVKNASYVMGCLHRLNIIIDELDEVYKPRIGREYTFMSNGFFKIYHMGLMYIFICEYCKLLENKVDGRREEHYASLAKLNEKVKNIDCTYSKYDEVKEKIESLYNSDFHKKKIRVLRDNNFAHLDMSGDAFSVKEFNDDEFETAKAHVKEMINILNLCGTSNGCHYLIETDVKYGEKFIEEFSKYQETRGERTTRILEKYKAKKD